MARAAAADLAISANDSSPGLQTPLTNAGRVVRKNSQCERC